MTFQLSSDFTFGCLGFDFSFVIDVIVIPLERG